jgi:hypothetical protein
MKRFFFLNVHLHEGRHRKTVYKGSVFSGAQFKDHLGDQIIKCHEIHKYKKGLKWPIKYSGETNVCGNETDTSSEWITLGGPIKGSYAVIIGMT